MILCAANDCWSLGLHDVQNVIIIYDDMLVIRSNAWVYAKWRSRWIPAPVDLVHNRLIDELQCFLPCNWWSPNWWTSATFHFSRCNFRRQDRHHQGEDVCWVFPEGFRRSAVGVIFVCWAEKLIKSVVKWFCQNLAKNHDLHGIIRESKWGKQYLWIWIWIKFRLVHSPRSNYRYIMVVAFSNKPVLFFAKSRSLLFLHHFQAKLPGVRGRGGLT